MNTVMPRARPETRDVPCGSCHLCCRADSIILHPKYGDDPSLYETEPEPRFPGMLRLKHKSNGDCIYLGEDGCTIHEYAPVICRSFDCRELVKLTPYTQTRKLVKRGILDRHTINRGRELLGKPPITL